MNSHGFDDDFSVALVGFVLDAVRLPGEDPVQHANLLLVMGLRPQERRADAELRLQLPVEPLETFFRSC